MNQTEAIREVEKFIKRALVAAGDDPEIQVKLYAYGATEDDYHNRSAECGLRVSEVSVTKDREGGGMSGASWMQTDRGGIAVCGQAERCIIALIEDWDSVQDGEIREEFWRLGNCMLDKDWTDELAKALYDHFPGKPYIEA